MANIIKFLNDGGIIIKTPEGIYAHKGSFSSLPLIVGKEEGEKLFSQGREMFIFRMDDSQWIAHFSEEEALEYYQERTGVPMEELKTNFEEWGLVPLTDVMFWDAQDISEQEANMSGIEYEGKTPYGECYKVTFEWVLQNRSSYFPGFIASTEG